MNLDLLAPIAFFNSEGVYELELDRLIVFIVLA